MPHCAALYTAACRYIFEPEYEVLIEGSILHCRSGLYVHPEGGTGKCGAKLVLHHDAPLPAEVEQRLIFTLRAGNPRLPVAYFRAKKPGYILQISFFIMFWDTCNSSICTPHAAMFSPPLPPPPKTAACNTPSLVCSCIRSKALPTLAVLSSCTLMAPSIALLSTQWPLQTFASQRFSLTLRPAYASHLAAAKAPAAAV